MSTNKRGVEALTATIGALILIFIGVALTFPLFPKILQGADDAIKDEICRINIDLRRHEIQVNVNLGVDLRLATLRAPLKGCVTVDKKEIPKKGESEELVKKAIADLMKDCWQRYDEGRAGDIFKEGSPWINNCQTCYVFKVKKNAKITGKISTEEFTQYLATTPYKAKDTTHRCFTFGKDRGGFCANKKEECTQHIKTDLRNIEFDEKNTFCKKNHASKGEGCCYSNIDCLNNGGECSKGYLGPNYTVYPNWKCPRDETCYIKKENDLSYLSYLQRGVGPGGVYILTDIEPNEIYAISFGAPTKECTTSICNAIVGGYGFVAAAATGLLAAKVAGVACATGVLCIPAIVIGAGVTIGGGIFGALIGQQGVRDLYVPLVDWWRQRPTSTIYLSTVSQITDQKVTGQEGPLCSIIPE